MFTLGVGLEPRDPRDLGCAVCGCHAGNTRSGGLDPSATHLCFIDLTRTWIAEGTAP